MLRKISSVIALVMLVGIRSVVASGPAEAMSLYANWAQFKPGTFVTYKTNSEMSGMKTQSDLTYKLKDVTQEKVVLEVKTVTEVMGNKIESPASTMEIPKAGQASVAIPGVPAGNAQAETKKETLKVKDTDIEANVVTSEVENGGNKTKATVWVSNTFPGLTLKSVVKIAGAASTTTEMTVVDFKLIK